MALLFTGRQHAGENLADMMKRRSAELPPPVQMCDALSRTMPKLAKGVEILLANCLAHGRRQFAEVAANFPAECLYVLKMLGEVYRNDAVAREQGMSPEERLRFHQERGFFALRGSKGWLRSSAWMPVFSSTHSASAFSGGFRYRPTMSSSLASKSGSGLKVKVRMRCGCKPEAARIWWTVLGGRRTSLARVRTVQRLKNFGF
jgi:hypothetical protein